jgi:tryptophan 2-monooxygenase
VWTAVERTHYMGASKLFVVVDRPFWRDPSPADPSRDTMSMTLTDRMPRGVYLLDDGPDKPGVMCLSYTWVDDSMKFVPLSREERLEVVLSSLAEIYPHVDIRSHIIGTPLTVSWETEPYFMGAFKANLPGQYRYQRRLYTHFMQDSLPAHQRGLFLAGDDISWTAGWAEGAVTTALRTRGRGTSSTRSPRPCWRRGSQDPAGTFRAARRDGRAFARGVPQASRLRSLRSQSLKGPQRRPLRAFPAEA